MARPDAGYRVYHYPDNEDLGMVEARSPRVAAEFTGARSLEAAQR